MSSRIKIFFFHFTLLLLVLGLGLLVLEFLVRVRDLAPEVGYVRVNRYRLSANQKMGYEPNPDVAISGDELFRDDWLGVDMDSQQMNSLGFRDREHSLDKKESRILILGDSIAAGWAIPNKDDLFVHQMEKNLLEKNTPVEVLNFGVIGYNTQQEVEMLREKGVHYKPDLVVLAYCLNDEERTSYIYSYLLHAEMEKGILDLYQYNHFLMKSSLYRFFRFRLLGNPKPKNDQEIKERFDALSTYALSDSFAELKQLSEKYDFKVLVVLFPYFEDLDQYEYQDRHQRIANHAKTNDFTFLDLLEDFRQCQKTTGWPVKFDRTHPNQYGHLCAGRAIAEYIRKNDLIH